MTSTSRAPDPGVAGPPDVDALEAQARALGDPTRHAIFRRLADADEPLTVPELTDHVGRHHTAVRQHLAKLVAAGLVTEEPEVRTTRGRPRLRYTVVPGAAGRWNVASPYERLAVLLAEALRTGEAPADVGRRAGSLSLPSIARDPVEALAAEVARQGFEPSIRRRRAGIEFVLGRCPYQAAVLANPDAACGLHLGLAQAAADTIGGVEVEGLVPRDPRRAGCRILLRATPAEPAPIKH
jgi:predicted ArsR family transcriptional regulator